MILLPYYGVWKYGFKELEWKINVNYQASFPSFIKFESSKLWIKKDKGRGYWINCPKITK